jgi:ethanolamine transporter EutH
VSASAKSPLSSRFRGALLKPASGESDAATPPAPPLTELESEARYATDKERLFGLIAAPFAALIGLLVVSALIQHDPAALQANGLANPRHVDVGFYHEILIAVLALAIAMLASAWFRKRLFLGVTMALFGLTLFNLHYWGFAVPYLLCAGWLLVRGYRLQKAVKEATTTEAAATTPGSPRASKRYTPPAAGSAR